MAVKTFTTGEVLTAADTNTYLNNGGLVYVTGSSFSGIGVASYNIAASGYTNFCVVMDNMTGTGAGSPIYLRPGGIVGGYYYGGVYYTYAAAPATASFGAGPGNEWPVGYVDGSANKAGSVIWITNVRTAVYKTYTLNASTANSAQFVAGQMRDANVRDTLDFFVAGVTMAGTIRIYGVRQP